MSIDLLLYCCHRPLIPNKFSAPTPRYAAGPAGPFVEKLP